MTSSTESDPPAIAISKLSYAYGRRQALRDLDLEIDWGEVFMFLGPNGSGKTTLFRLLSTLIPLQQGTVRVLGWNLSEELQQVRQRMGVVFQAASLDKKLTVAENLRHQAVMYGLAGPELVERQRDLLQQMGLADRSNELTESLSGGLRRRVELAKGMIHRPELLLMDEPSTGLDPGARADLWDYLRHLRERFGVTVVMTTHLLEEADKADRIAILHEGTLVAMDRPDALRATIGGDTITIAAADPTALASDIQQRFAIDASVVDRRVRLEQADAGKWIARLVEAFPDQIEAITLAKPTLEDVFIDKTGHRFLQQLRELP